MTAASPPAWRARAPAKVNLGLFVGPRREDGRHELATVMQSISLADELVLSLPGGADGREVVCAGVSGPNLAAAALEAYCAAAGWTPPALRLEIDKRIPVAAGLAGGSADAAAALRLAAAASGLGSDVDLLALAAPLGADVPAQVRPGRWLAGGAGERLTALAPPAAPLGVLVLPVDAALSTADVYAELDRSRRARGAGEIGQFARRLEAALGAGAPLPPAELLVNDLQQAALSLCPAIDVALAQARDAGADAALVSGSGPTVVGVFAGGEPGERMALALRELAGRPEGAIATAPVGAGFGDPAVA